MIVGVHAQHFLRDQFEREQKLGAVAEEEIDIGALEFYDQIRVFKIRVAVVAGLQPETQTKAGIVDDAPKELLDPGTRFVNRILLTQARFLPSLRDGIAFLAGIAAGAGPAVLLKNHCCAMPTKLLVSQYNTRPLDAGQKKKPYMRGMNCIIFCCAGSTPAEMGVIFCMMKLETIMMIGRKRMAKCSGCERSLTQSHGALRISIATESTL